MTVSNRPKHSRQRIPGPAFSARSLGFVSLALVAAVGFAAAPAQADEIDLDSAGAAEIRSHLDGLKQRRASESERLDLLTTERSDLEALIESAESDFGTVEAQLSQATEALNDADGDLSGAIEALGAFRTEQAERFVSAEQASARLESVAPQITQSAENIERLDDEISSSKRALERAEQAEAARAQPVAATRSESSGGPTASPDPPDSANAVVRFAYDQLGKPYGFGQDGPHAYDCSGLVVAAYAQSGVSLSRTSQSQWNDTAPISRSDLAPGDLVFFGTGHTSIYIGGNQVIHATKPGDIVKIASIDVMPVSGYRRVRD